ncbi:MAG: phosphatidylglycerophosphatase A, partial [Myxococcota bacterium]
MRRLATTVVPHDWKDRLAWRIAVVGGVGLSPWGPGTAGSLVSLLLWGPLVMLSAPVWARAAVVVTVTLLGVWASAATAPMLGEEDPRQIVIDEVAGQGVALLLCPPSLGALVLAFGLFRLFDIAKPWPISLIDRRVKGAWGIMLDDVAAGLAALATLFVLGQNDCLSG